MKPLLKVMLILGAIFATTFVLGRVFGILTVANVRLWLEWAGAIDPWVLASVVIGLLFIDLFVAVPTLTITILAGFFLGFGPGLAASLVGVTAAAFAGYTISWFWGDRIIPHLVKDQLEREKLSASFHAHGPLMILLARAAPILPEVTSCMAGATKMNIWRFSIFLAIGTIPYVAIATYAGSISDLENPKPAIFAALLLYAVMWTGWYIARKRLKSDQLPAARSL
ncbi:MAG: VTT domain-containing protein [Pseudomonadota bacterium]